MTPISRVTSPVQHAAKPAAETEISRKERELKSACQDFEAVLFSQMIRSMRNSMPEGGLLKKNQGERVFQDMLDAEYAKEISKTGTTGLADVLFDELRKSI